MRFNITIDFDPTELLEQAQPLPLRGYVARLIDREDNGTKSKIVIGLVPEPEREFALLDIIFDEYICQILYTEMPPDLTEALIFKFYEYYNEDSGFYELDEIAEQNLLSLLSKIYEEV